MIVAAIDVGTNTVRVLVRDGDTEILRDQRIVRLGAGVDAQGVLAADALERALDAIEAFAREGRAAGAEPVVFATSAVRDAANRATFEAAVRARTNCETRILSGDEEAQLAFAGATARLGPGDKLVCDIGGGSTELILGDDAPQTFVSMQLGSVRMTERHRGPGPAGVDVAAMQAEIDTILATSWTQRCERAAFVGVAGTVTTLAAIALGLETYDRSLVDGAFLPLTTIEGLAARLAAWTPAERLTRYPVIQAGREDVLLAGALILGAAIRQVGADGCIVSEHDILDGMASALDDPA